MIFINHDLLDLTHLRLCAGHDPKHMTMLRADAKRAADVGCTSVIDYPGFPDNPHDYYSLARYYHPNPETADGLPYVSRDGILNPSSITGPKRAMQQLAADVLCLAVASVLIDGAYAPVIMARLEKWFLNPQTAMRPHLNHAQAKRGINTGTAAGVIDAHIWINIVLGLEILETCQPNDQFFGGMRDWFGRLADWLYTSDHGISARAIGNNITAWWAAMVMVFARYGGNRHHMVDDVTHMYRDLLDTKMDRWGCFYGELGRTRSMHYNLFFLNALEVLATCGNLWGIAGRHGSVCCAIDYMMPYLQNPRIWPHPQIMKETYRGSALIAIAARKLSRPDIGDVNNTLARPRWGDILGPTWLWI